MKIAICRSAIVLGIVLGAWLGGPALAGLTPDEEAALRDGKGMGLAKPAELNGYPGPRHVIDLAAQLELTPAQLEKTQALFARMQQAARTEGTALIEAEHALDELYASKTATVEKVDAQLATIETIRVHLRAIHLHAHLEQAALMTAPQRMKYAQLRGYDQAMHPGH